MLIDSFRALGRGACAAAIVGGALASCGEVLSLEISPPTADADAGVPADLPPCDPGESPGEGVFVSAAFGLPGGLGTRETPLRSIQDALEAAAAKGLSRVFVDEGTYEESLTLTDRHAGVVVSGGWKGSEAGWRRNCDEGARARTILASPDAVAVRVRATEARPTSAFDSLTITTKAIPAAPPDTSGESAIGVFVTGPASLRLRNVRVLAARGGDGGPATPAPAAAGTMACDGLTGCANGAGGTQGSPGAPAGEGTFGPNGYVAGDGAPGGQGGAGANGAAGTQGVSNYCAEEIVGECNTGGGICEHRGRNRSSESGKCGCGGLGGAGGRPGRGGGASVALLVVGAGTVALENTDLAAAGGGDGAAGGDGTAGTEGSPGSKGNSLSCFTTVQPVGTGAACQCQLAGSATLAGGAPGEPGGHGGDGAAGGGGAGGPSHAWVVVGDAKVLVDATSVTTVGPGGAGAGGAPGGASSPSRVAAGADAGTD